MTREGFVVRSCWLGLVLILSACGGLDPSAPTPSSSGEGAVAESPPEHALDRHLHVALAHRAQGDLQEARTALEKLHDAAPEEPAGLLGLAVLAVEAGELDLARDLIDRTIAGTRRVGNIPDIHLVVRELALAEGRGSDAFAALRTASDAAPDDPYLALAVFERAPWEGGSRRSIEGRYIARARGAAAGDPGVEMVFADWACTSRGEVRGDCLPALYDLMALLDPVEGPEAFGRAAKDFRDSAGPEPPDSVGRVLASLLATPEYGRTMRRVADAPRPRPLERLVRSKLPKREDLLGPPIRFEYEALPPLPGAPTLDVQRVEHGWEDGARSPSGWVALRGRWLLFAPCDLPRDYTFVAALGEHPSMVVADVDDDPEVEIVTLDADEIRIFEWNGEGFEAGEILGVPGPGRLTPIDYDGDGDLDLLVLRGRHPAKLFLNPGRLGDTSGSRRMGTPEAPSIASSATPVDLDGDGDLDLAYITQSRVALARNLGRGAWKMLPHHGGMSRNLTTRPPRPLLAVPGLSADRRDVLLLIGGRIELFTESATREHVKRRAPRFREAALGRPAGAVVADVDLDGYEEVVLWSEREGVRAGSARFGIWSPGPGSGRYEDGPFYGIDFAPEARVGGLVPADVDGDLDLDFVGWTRPERGASDTFVLRNHGAETQGRLGLELHGPPQGAADGRGVTVEVRRAGRTERIFPSTPTPTLGFGDAAPYVVTATWSDGGVDRLIDPGPGIHPLVHPGR